MGAFSVTTQTPWYVLILSAVCNCTSLQQHIICIRAYRHSICESLNIYPLFPCQAAAVCPATVDLYIQLMGQKGYSAIAKAYFISHRDNVLYPHMFCTSRGHTCMQQIWCIVTDDTQNAKPILSPVCAPAHQLTLLLLSYSICTASQPQLASPRELTLCYVCSTSGSRLLWEKSDWEAVINDWEVVKSRYKWAFFVHFSARLAV